MTISIAEISGVLIIDKPEGMTSHDVVNRVRLRFRNTKVGHLGTLDPMATGVLPLCIGKATRIGPFLESSPKEYTGEIRFGFSTTTYDRNGDAVGEEIPCTATYDELLRQVASLTGEIQQQPPAFSAKKIGGVPSYKFARRGRPIATPPVTVHIHQFVITHFDPPRARFRVTCSPGTYVRSLAHDLGRLLGCGAHLTSLRRTRSGWFREESVVTLDAAAADQVIPLDRLLERWPRIEISGTDEVRIAHGNPIPGPGGSGEFVRIFNKRGEFVAVAVLENGWVHPRVVLTSLTSK